MPDVFISYVEEDGRIADQIAQGLQAARYSTWHYEQNGLPGSDYLETIGAVIDAAQAIVIIISARSLQSQQVYRELVRAAENGKALFPLLYGIKHEQFQERGPKWRQALGATTSIAIPPEGVEAIMPRLLAGLKMQRIEPTGPEGPWTPPPPPPPPSTPAPAPHPDLGLRPRSGGRDGRNRSDHEGGVAPWRVAGRVTHGREPGAGGKGRRNGNARPDPYAAAGGDHRSPGAAD
jgi:hypothetical protein